MTDRSSQPTSLAIVLQDLRPARASYGRLDLHDRWGITLPFEDGVRFHLVVEGGCILQVPGREVLRLEAGDMALLPHGSEHAILDRAGSAKVPIETLSSEEIGKRVYSLHKGEDGTGSVLVCCTVGFDAPFAQRLLQQMPAVIVVKRNDGAIAGLRALADLMADEARRQRIGMATLLPRLADIIVTWVVRHWAETSAGHAEGWLSAFSDPGLGRALAAIHREPARSWTTARMARVAGMSRTVFAARFSMALGQPPGQYVLETRMALARERLMQAGSTIAETAAAAGYGSEAAFSRAFKRVTGSTPGAVRRAER